MFPGLLLLAAACVASACAQDLTGAGASFPNPIYAHWFAEYGRLHPGVRINYQPIGSGAGIRQVSQRIVDFGATDRPLTDQQAAQARVPLLHVPTVVGAVVPVYNLPGITQTLRLAPDVLADIYLGRITHWNDARLRRDNHGLDLPMEPIAVIYRAEGSGTTYVFTDYLSKVSNEFGATVGRDMSVRWPVGLGAKGNEGVSSAVRSIPYSLGYVELAYSLDSGLTASAVRNAAGSWVMASQETVSAAVLSRLQSMPPDYRVSITNAPGANAYPIASFTWLLLPEQAKTTAKSRALVDFLRWMLAQGQQEAWREKYVALPAPLVERLRASVNRLH